MTNSLGFINLLTDHPWVGILFGLLIVGLMFWAKHFMVKLMDGGARMQPQEVEREKD